MQLTESCLFSMRWPWRSSPGFFGGERMPTLAMASFLPRPSCNGESAERHLRP